MQYLLFAGYNYYPGGGMNDFVEEFSTVEDAKRHAANVSDSYGSEYDWWHIYDAHTGLVYYHEDFDDEDEDLTEEQNGL